MKEKKKFWLIAGLVLFIGYFFAAARPIPRETVLVSRWLCSLESAIPVSAAGAVPQPEAADDGTDQAGSGFGALMPFVLGNRFGYVDAAGRFSINRIKKDNLCLSEHQWTEYGATPGTIEIRGNTGEALMTINNPFGYPVLLDNRVFLLGSQQNSLSAVDSSGKILWTYEFGAPLTCIDAAAGLVLAGSLDGAAEVLDMTGKRVFFFEPGGSRYPVILGCAISRDGSKLGIVSGVDDQRVLLLERFGGAGGEYKVIFHEFLEDGFRRPVHISFIDQDRWLVFEREGGIGVYEIGARRERKIPLEGGIDDIDHSGGNGFFFVISSMPGLQKKLTGIRLPGKIFMEAPFKSGDAFLGRQDSLLISGGGGTLASFNLEKK